MDSRSYVEIEFPHLVKGLTDAWKNPRESRAYLDELVTDKRGERIGFPPPVFEELMFLHDLLWQLRHPEADHVDIYMNSFRYAVNPDKEPRF
jgi:hypothetical protein